MPGRRITVSSLSTLASIRIRIAFAFFERLRLTRRAFIRPGGSARRALWFAATPCWSRALAALLAGSRGGFEIGNGGAIQFK
jgi:hypothetical protein